MRTLKMTWNTERGRLVCHWVQSGEREERGPLTKRAPESGVRTMRITSGTSSNGLRPVRIGPRY